jgi:Flp pilus assembly pilin Flp
MRDESGATAIEYGLMVATLSLPTIFMMRMLGFWTNNMFLNFVQDLHDMTALAQ